VGRESTFCIENDDDLNESIEDGVWSECLTRQHSNIKTKPENRAPPDLLLAHHFCHKFEI
jgi:hypothetical protein